MANVEPTPVLGTVIRDSIAAALRGARVALPAQVTAYDATTQTCSAQPLVQDGVMDETGTRRPTTLPIVTMVPVVFPGSGSSYAITYPLAVGDTVLLVFASSAIGRWLALGGVVDPIDDRRHHLTDAIAIAGLRDLPHKLGATATDATALVVSAPTIKLGDATATEAAVKGTTYRSAEDAYFSALNTMLADVAVALATLLTALNTPSATVSTVGAACDTDFGTVATAAGQLVTAIATFSGGASSYLSTKVKIGG